MSTQEQLCYQDGQLPILNCLRLDDGRESRREILEGLSRPQKRLPSKYFYDAYGSWLFDRICDLPEYYPTRTELAILEQYGREIMAFFAAEGGDLVELGSGSHRKIKILLDAATQPGWYRLRYLPVDISESALAGAAAKLLENYPDLSVQGIIADFTRHLEVLPAGRKVILFLGSTIGNFSNRERLIFLRKIATHMGAADRFVLGLDMLKPAEIITAAYNDRQGVTAEFNLNILRHLNLAFHADFDLADFRHEAVFVPARERMEMHLRAKRDTRATIADLDVQVSCRVGESIRTEICQKFSRTRAEAEFRLAGLTASRWFTDPQGWFSLVLLQKAPPCLWRRAAQSG